MENIILLEYEYLYIVYKIQIKNSLAIHFINLNYIDMRYKNLKNRLRNNFFKINYTFNYLRHNYNYFSIFMYHIKEQSYTTLKNILLNSSNALLN